MKLAGVLVIMMMGVSPAAPATARDEVPPGAWTTCQRTGEPVADAWGDRYTEWVCENDADAPVYRSYWSGKVRKIGELRETRSTFLCWQRGAWHWGSGDVWYYTRATRITGRGAEHGWGYTPALYVHNDPDPVAGMPECRSA